jgi:hypothetical protein
MTGQVKGREGQDVILHQEKEEFWEGDSQGRLGSSSESEEDDQAIALLKTGQSFAGQRPGPIVEVATDKTCEFLEVIDALAARCVATSSTSLVHSWRPRSGLDLSRGRIG